MYVCVCNAVTERQVESAMREGATTLEHLREVLAVGTCCGCCTEFLEDRFVRDASQEIPLSHSGPQRAA